MAMTKRPKKQYSSEIINLENMIPENHFLRVIEEYFDWNFIYDEVEKQYSVFGRPSIDPVVLFKIHILKFLFHEDSLRKTYEALQYNVLIVINEFLGENATISYDVYVKGKPTVGSVTITDGKPSFTVSAD